MKVSSVSVVLWLNNNLRKTKTKHVYYTVYKQCYIKTYCYFHFI